MGEGIEKLEQYKNASGRIQLSKFAWSVVDPPPCSAGSILREDETHRTA